MLLEYVTPEDLEIMRSGSKKVVVANYRAAIVGILRNQNYTFAEIAKALNRSGREAAHKLYQKYLVVMKKPEYDMRLYKTVLMMSGLNTQISHTINT
jgi:hypothetical protein